MENGERNKWMRQVFAIENHHRLIKQCCEIEKAQVRSVKAQNCHNLLSSRAFVRLKAHRLLTSISGYAVKVSIIRKAIRLYFQKLTIQL